MQIFNHAIAMRHADEILRRLKSAKFHPEQMSFRDRAACLKSAEEIYLNAYTAAKVLCLEQTDTFRRRRLAEGILDTFRKYSPVQVRAGTHGEYCVRTFTTMHRSISQVSAGSIGAMVEAGLDYAVSAGAEFATFKGGTVIVKRFGHCSDMRMGTMENREAHMLSDAIMSRMGTDDHPYNFNAVYVWCESDMPRTEIVIVQGRYASNYGDYVRDLYEASPEIPKRQLYRQRHYKVARLMELAEELQSELGMLPDVGVGKTALDRAMASRLRSIAKYISLIIPMLRVTAPGDEESSPSQQYTKGAFSRSSDYERYEYLNATEGRYDDEISTLYTDSPVSLYSKGGRLLCDFHESMLREITPDSGPIGWRENGDLALEVTRYIPDTNVRYCDADNINIRFISDIEKRVKVIKSWSEEKPFSFENDAKIRLMRPVRLDL